LINHLLPCPPGDPRPGHPCLQHLLHLHYTTGCCHQQAT
jgi:hypothetical protein